MRPFAAGNDELRESSADLRQLNAQIRRTRLFLAGLRRSRQILADRITKAAQCGGLDPRPLITATFREAS